MQRNEAIATFSNAMYPYVSAEFLTWLIENKFFDMPASVKYHGCHTGGLFEHSLSVMKHLVALTENNGLTWQHPRSPYIVGMFHDLCKIDQYRATHLDGIPVTTEFTQEPVLWEYNPDMLLKGHGEKSVMLLAQYLTLTEEEIACIRYHMGAFTPEKEWNDYTRAVNLWPNVLWTHHADMLASHVEGA